MEIRVNQQPLRRLLRRVARGHLYVVHRRLLMAFGYAHNLNRVARMQRHVLHSETVTEFANQTLLRPE